MCSYINQWFAQHAITNVKDSTTSYKYPTFIKGQKLRSVAAHLHKSSWTKLQYLLGGLQINFQQLTGTFQQYIQISKVA